MDASQIMDFITNDLPKIAQSLLMIIGGLKVIARYTPMKWDDHLFDWIEVPLCMFRKKGKK